MADEIFNLPRTRRPSGAFALCGVASMTVLANHPRGGTGSFAVLIKDEAAHQAIAGVVHGRFCWLVSY